MAARSSTSAVSCSVAEMMLTLAVTIAEADVIHTDPATFSMLRQSEPTAEARCDTTTRAAQPWQAAWTAPTDGGACETTSASANPNPNPKKFGKNKKYVTVGNGVAAEERVCAPRGHPTDTTHGAQRGMAPLSQPVRTVRNRSRSQLTEGYSSPALDQVQPRGGAGGMSI